VKREIYLLLSVFLVSSCVETGPTLRPGGEQWGQSPAAAADPGPPKITTGEATERTMTPKFDDAQGEIVWSEFGQPAACPLDPVVVTARRPRLYGLLGVGDGFKLKDGPYMIGPNRGPTIWIEDGYIDWVIVKLGDTVLKNIDIRERFKYFQAASNPIPIIVRSRFGKEEQLVAHLGLPTR